MVKRRRSTMARRGENIYKRKDGRYEGRYIYNYDVFGKAKYRSVYAHSYAEVKEKLRNLKSGTNHNKRKTNLTLSDWMKIWLDGRQDIKLSTKQLYQRTINNHIIPKLGNFRLQNLSTEIIQLFISSLQYAPATIKLIFAVLKLALKAAQNKNLISNIYSDIELPKKEQKKLKVLSRSEQYRLESVLLYPNDIGVLICLYTGIRIGELCALKWENIDLEKAQLNVCGTQSRINGELIVTTPKSKSSMRTIPIPDILLTKLKEAKKSGEFVLHSHNCMIDVRSYSRYFKNVLKRAGLNDIKFHSLRHPYVKLKLKFLLTQHYRCISAKVLDFPLNFKPVVGVNIHFVYEHICECLCQGVFLFHCFCCLQSF